MTKKEMILFLEDLKKVRDMLTPAQAAQVPNLFPKIKEGKEIKKGERVNVDGQVFKAREDIKEPKKTTRNTMASLALQSQSYILNLSLGRIKDHDRYSKSN